MGFSRNVGGADRTIRFVASAAPLALAIFVPAERWVKGLLYVVAAGTFFTGLFQI